MDDIQGIHRALIDLKRILGTPDYQEELNSKIKEIRDRLLLVSYSDCIRKKLLDGLQFVEGATSLSPEVISRIRDMAEDALAYPHEQEGIVSLEVVSEVKFLNLTDLEIAKLARLAIREGKPLEFFTLSKHPDFLKIGSADLASLLCDALDKDQREIVDELIHHSSFKELNSHQIGTCLSRAIRSHHIDAIYMLMTHDSYKNMDHGSVALCLCVAIRDSRDPLAGRFLLHPSCENFSYGDLQFIYQAAKTAKNEQMIRYCEAHRHFRKI